MDATQPPARRKILIIRLSSMGDIVLTTPVVRVLDEQLDQVEIHYLLKKQNEDVLAFNPHIDKLHFFEGDMKATIQELKAEKFDFVVDLHRKYRSRRICCSLGVPYSVMHKLDIRKMLLVRLKANLLPVKHVVDCYFEALRPLHVKNDGKGLDFFIPDNQEFDTDDLPVFFDDGYVAVVLGAAHATKRIPVSKIIEIVTILHRPIILLGGSDVADEGEEIVSQLGDRAYNACGKFNILQSASLINQSACVLTGDTGLMHIAAALGKPVCSLWGNTVPEFGMYPYMPGQRKKFRLFEVQGLCCRPCSKRGFKKCPYRHFKCMMQIPAIEVAEWINQF